MRRSKPPVIFFLNCLLLTVCFALSASSAFTRESPPADFSKHSPSTTLTLAYPGLESEICYELARNLYAEAFGRLGYAIRIVSLPSERSLIETNAGNYDGQISRAKEFDPENRYPNLVIVPEPLLPLEVAAFALDQDLKIDGWVTLSETPCRITYQRGVKMIEQRLLRYIDSARLIQADNLVHAARLLVSGRVRILIGIPTTFDSVLELAEFQSAGIHIVGLLETFYAYPVLHKRHSPLIPELARVLREMKADGTFCAIIQAYRLCRPGAPPQEP
ncbi:MAG: substrate-binding periplasmic protein [Thermodesulfobacteriota bacterium]